MKSQMELSIIRLNSIKINRTSTEKRKDSWRNFSEGFKNHYVEPHNAEMFASRGSIDILSKETDLYLNSAIDMLNVN